MNSLPPWLDSVSSSVHLGLSQGRLPHALLLIGRGGDGLHELGRHLGDAILCASQNRPCGQCKSCLLVKAGLHPDRLVVEPEGKSDTIKVAQVRAIGQFMHETAQQGGNKVIRLVGADRMNTSSANALLKMLEEPTRDTYLILEATSLSRLLPTVRSRCRIYKLDRPDEESARRYLMDQGMDPTEAQNRLSMSEGAPMDALRLDADTMEQWKKQAATFLQETGFSALASFISQQQATNLLRQLLLWVDGALRLQHNTQVVMPETDRQLADRLRQVKGVSLFEFRDYILELMSGLQHQANLNQQMWSEQLAARWLELRL